MAGRSKSVQEQGAGDVVSLVGEDSRRMGELLVECALGHRPLSALGGAASRRPDGSIELQVDQATWDAFGFNA